MDNRAHDALMEELVNNQKRLVLQTRIGLIVNGLLGLALVVVLAVMIPQLARAGKALTAVEQAAADAGTLIGNTETMVADASVLIENANAMVTDNTEAVTETVQKLNEVDFEGLNEAIGKLNTAVTPLTNLASLFQ